MDVKIKTKIIKIDPRNPDKDIIRRVAVSIKKGGVVVYPTETCYGLGTDATNPEAVEKIRRIKGRSTGKPISIIVPDLKTMEKYGRITDEIKFLAKKFLPGPLTIITHKKDTIPDILNPKEIAFRVPSHPVAYLLTKEAKIPITATSANISGLPSIYKISDVVDTFDGKVDIILDCGDLPIVKPSTIIDVKNSPRIIREGPIPGSLVLSELKNFERSKQNNK